MQLSIDGEKLNHVSLIPGRRLSKQCQEIFFYEMIALSAPNDFSVVYDDDKDVYYVPLSENLPSASKSASWHLPAHS